MDYAHSDAYVQQLLAEHDKLETIANLIGDRFAMSSDTGWEEVDRPVLMSQLAALKAGLLGHIEEEEKGGVVEEAVIRMPSLSQESRQIFEESDDLKEDLLSIIDLVAENKRVEAAERFKKFAVELKLHDQHEAAVVQKGLNFYPFES